MEVNIKRYRFAFINAVELKGWGGLENWLVNCASGLKKRGHHSIIIGRPESKYIKRAEMTGIKTYRINIGPDFDPIRIVKLRNIFKKERIELLCVSHNKDLRLGGIAARMTNKNIKVISRKGMVQLKNNIKFRWTYDKLVDGIIAPSKSLKAQLEEYRWLNKKVTVIPVGVNLDDYTQEYKECHAFLIDEYNLPDNSFICGTASRLEIQKGHQYLIQAIAKISQNYPKIRLVMIGEGAYQPVLKQLTLNLGIENKVIFAGYYDDKSEINKHIAGYDLFILPSVIEPFGQVLIEAMALKRPIVASRAGGIVEAVKENETAFLVNTKDPKELKEKIEFLIHDQELRNRMGNEGRKRVEQYFSFDVMIDRVEEYFINMIENREKNTKEKDECLTNNRCTMV
jgi:glycosyltransferase involved in cell wall biosynthesis